MATIQIKRTDWLKIRSGGGILIYSAGQGLNTITGSKIDFLKLCVEYGKESRCMNTSSTYCSRLSLPQSHRAQNFHVEIV